MLTFTGGMSSAALAGQRRIPADCTGPAASPLDTEAEDAGKARQPNQPQVRGLRAQQAALVGLLELVALVKAGFE